MISKKPRRPMASVSRRLQIWALWHAHILKGPVLASEACAGQQRRFRSDMQHLAHSSGTARKMRASTSLGRPQIPPHDKLWRMRLPSELEPWDMLGIPSWLPESSLLYRLAAVSASQAADYTDVLLT